jgi:hypothetical protein
MRRRDARASAPRGAAQLAVEHDCHPAVFSHAASDAYMSQTPSAPARHFQTTSRPPRYIRCQSQHRLPQQLARTATVAARNPRKRRARILPPETHPAKRAQHLLARRCIVAAISTSATIRTNTIPAAAIVRASTRIRSPCASSFSHFPRDVLRPVRLPRRVVIMRPAQQTKIVDIQRRPAQRERKPMLDRSEAPFTAAPPLRIHERALSPIALPNSPRDLHRHMS